jgi:hypothetical protein
MLNNLFLAMKSVTKHDSSDFDETKLSDSEWVKWKRRCAKHLNIEITDADEVILASRKTSEGEKGHPNKESL